MNNTTPISMTSRGYYTLSKVDAFGNSRTEGCPSNIVCNVVTYEGAYYSLILSSMFGTLYAEIGASSTERTRSDTALGAPDTGVSGGASATGRSGNEVDNGNGTSTITLTRVMSFSLGEKVGTFSEVGVRTSSSLSGTFIAGQLIKDEFGDPTTVTVLSDEQLTVTYTLEWTVPNTSNLIGTGTVVDASSNSYPYEIWAQPYFADYTGTSTSPRYFRTSAGALALRGASGTSPRPDTPSDDGWTLSKDSVGLVTAVSDNKVYSPLDFSAVDIVFMGIHTFYTVATSSDSDIVDTTKVLGASSNASFAACYIKFGNPISKTDQQSFSIQVEMKVQV